MRYIATILACLFAAASWAQNIEYVLMGAAHARGGAEGSIWYSDLSASLTNDELATFVINYYPAGNEWNVSTDATLEPGSWNIRLMEVLKHFFGNQVVGSAGTLTIQTDEEMSAVMQTWTWEAGGGRYGQSIRPAMPLNSCETYDVHIPADRVNMWAFNGSWTSDGWLRVNGESYGLRPRETILVPDVPTIMTVEAGCSPISGAGESDRVYVLFSGVDNVTNDPTTYQIERCLCCLTD